MKTKRVAYSSDTPDYIVDGLIEKRRKDNLGNIIKSKENVLNQIKSGKVKFSDAQEVLKTEDRGLGVLEAEDGGIWWKDGEYIYRQDDTYLQDAVKMAMEKKAQKEEAQMEKEMPVKITPKFLKERPKKIPMEVSEEEAVPLLQALVEQLIKINEAQAQVDAKIESLKESEGYERLKTEKIKIAEDIVSKLEGQLGDSNTLVKKVQEKLLVIQSKLTRKEPTDAKKLKMVLAKFEEAKDYLARSVAQVSEAYKQITVTVVEPSKTRRSQVDNFVKNLQDTSNSLNSALSSLDEGLALLE